MAAGLAPRVGDNMTAFPALGKAILDAVTRRGRNNESARLLSGNSAYRGDKERAGKMREQRLSIEYQGRHVYCREDRAREMSANSPIFA